MRKFISLLMLLCVVTAMAKVGTMYVNPLQNETELNDNVVNRLYKKGMLGFAKAKTVDVMFGPKIEAGSAEAAKYDFIVDMNISNISSVDLVGETMNTINGVMNLFGAKKSEDNKFEFTSTIQTDVVIRNAKTGEELFVTTLAPSASDEDKDVAFFEATDNFDYDVLDMMDDAFAITGEILALTKENKKGEVKEIRAGIGKTAGARKGQMFKIFKVVNGERELLGMAKCEQVVNEGESVLSVQGKGDGDKKLADAYHNNTGEYVLEVTSCSKTGFIHENFQDLSKMFAKRERSHYLNPIGRTSKPTVGFIAVTSTDPTANQLVELLQKTVLDGLAEVTTINVLPQIFNSVEDARNAGVDALFEFTIDRLTRSKEEKKDSKGNPKTQYCTKIFYTMDAVDVENNSLIDMQSKWETSYQDKSQQAADEGVIKNVQDYVRHFGEDLFPMSGYVIESFKQGKDNVKEAIIEFVPEIGYKDGMHFDIYVQQKEGDEDARLLLGEGKGKKPDKDGNYIISVKGKNDGDKTLLDLLQGMDPNTEIIIISKTSYGVMGALDQFLGK